MGTAGRRRGSKLQHHQDRLGTWRWRRDLDRSFVRSEQHKLEYLYVDLGTVSNTIGTDLVPLQVMIVSGGFGTATGSTSFYSQNHIREQVIRVGINYRFDYAAVAPVVTKY